MSEHPPDDSYHPQSFEDAFSAVTDALQKAGHPPRESAEVRETLRRLSHIAASEQRPVESVVIEFKSRLGSLDSFRTLPHHVQADRQARLVSFIIASYYSPQ